MVQVQDGLKHIFPKEFIKIFGKEKINLIDIREPYELKELPIKHAINIPLGILINQFTSLLSIKETYYIICHHGQRSYLVTELLTNKGYDVINVVGGIDLVNRFDTVNN